MVSILTVPYGLSYGVGDGLGYLLGTLFHFSISDSLSSVLETTLLVVLGHYEFHHDGDRVDDEQVGY